MKRIKLSTDHLEDALDQIVRAKMTRTKASIHNSFVASLLKELIDRRKEDAVNCAIIQKLYYETEPLLKGKPVTVVEEVSTLSELGHTSWTMMDEQAETHADDRLDAFVVKAPKAAKPRIRNRVRARARGGDKGTSKWIIVALVVVIILTSVQVMLSFR